MCVYIAVREDETAMLRVGHIHAYIHTCMHAYMAVQEDETVMV